MRYNNIGYPDLKIVKELKTIHEDQNIKLIGSLVNTSNFGNLYGFILYDLKKKYGYDFRFYSIPDIYLLKEVLIDSFNLNIEIELSLFKEVI